MKGRVKVLGQDFYRNTIIEDEEGRRYRVYQDIFTKRNSYIPIPKEEV